MRFPLKHLLIVLLVGVAVAEEPGSEPREVVRLVADRVKSAESLLPVVDFIDWEERFKQLPEGEKIRLSVENAEDLEQYYRRLIEKNGEHRLEKVKEDLIRDVKDKTQLLNTIEKVQSELLNQRTEIKRRLGETSISITSVGKSTNKSAGQVSDDQLSEAIVQISREYRGSKVSASLKLRKVGDRWLLNSAAAFNPLANPESDDIIGPMPEPEAVLSIW